MGYKIERRKEDKEVRERNEGMNEVINGDDRKKDVEDGKNKVDREKKISMVDKGNKLIKKKNERLNRNEEGKLKKIKKKDSKK